jgi:Cof subfamily protein (haloacid dehalogenase superfamily)
VHYFLDKGFCSIPFVDTARRIYGILNYYTTWLEGDSFVRYRILVLDIDGTLTNSQKEISPATKQALHDLQASGVKVVLASGRPTCGMTHVAKEIELERFGGFLLSYNGGRITDCKTGQIIYQKVLPNACIAPLYAFAKEHGVHIMSYENDQIITEHPDDPYVEVEARINRMFLKPVNDFVRTIQFPVVKCIFTGDGGVLEALEPMAVREFEELNIYRSEPFFLEIMPPSIDKAYSLSKLLEHLGLTKEQMVACGDGFNDLSMIEYAGMGVAMANAQPVVKRAADWITSSNDEDGIVRVIHKFFNNGESVWSEPFSTATATASTRRSHVCKIQN